MDVAGIASFYLCHRGRPHVQQGCGPRDSATFYGDRPRDVSSGKADNHKAALFLEYWRTPLLPAALGAPLPQLPLRNGGVNTPDSFEIECPPRFERDRLHA